MPACDACHLQEQHASVFSIQRGIQLNQAEYQLPKIVRVGLVRLVNAYHHLAAQNLVLYIYDQTHAHNSKSNSILRFLQAAVKRNQVLYPKANLMLKNIEL